MDVPTFRAALELLASGALGAVLAFLLEKLAGWFQQWPPDAKKWFVFGFCMLVPLLAWFLQLAMGYMAVPGSGQEWVESIWHELALGFVAWGGSQATHILVNKSRNNIP